MIPSGPWDPFPRRPRRFHVFFWAALALAAALAVLWGHARVYLPFLSDDALISLRYARRLLQGRGLTWNDGERVEGYSNLLWVLACAGAGLMKVDLIVAARALGFIGTGAALAAIAFALRSPRFSGLLPALAGMMLVALADPVACWTLAGLEQGLMAGLLAWALVLSFPLLEENGRHGRHGQSGREWKRAVAPGALLGLLALTRPDGILFTPTIALTIMICNFGSNKLKVQSVECGSLLPLSFFKKRPVFYHTAILIAIPAACFLGQLAFRLLYYHDWLPNTAYVKLEPSLARIIGGFAYVRDGIVATKWPAGAAALGLVACSFDRANRRRAFMVALSLAVWLAYLVAIGGDVFPIFRHFVPAVVCMGLLAGLGLESLLRRPRPWPVRALLWAGCAIPFYFAVNEHILLAGSRRAIEEFWEWDGEILGAALKRAFAIEQPLLAVDPAGCVPYFSELPAIDMLGLNDRHIARHRAPLAPDMPRGVVAHDRGDGAYVLGRKPDLVVFNQPLGSESPCFRSGAEMFRLSEFQARYKLVLFEAEGKPFKFYVRAEDGRLAVRRAPGRVEVPSWLIADNPGRSVVRLDGRGRPQVEALPDKPAMLRGFALPAGTWSVAVDAATSGGEPLKMRLESGNVREFRLQAVFQIPPEGGAVDLSLWPRTGRAAIDRVTFIRQKAN